MRYAELFRLWLKHGYYTSGETADFEIIASEATRKLLGINGGMLKTRPTGVRVVVPADAAGVPLPAFSEEAVYHFYLLLRSSDFSLFTDLTEYAGLAAPLWTNAPVGDEPGGAFRLIDQDPIPPDRPRNTFVDIEVYPSEINPGEINPEEVNPDGTDPPELEIVFTAKSMLWAYYCITNLEPDEELTLGGDTTSLSFEPLELEDYPDRTDRVAVQVENSYGELRRIRFLSTQLVPCHERSGERLELQLKSSRVAGPLPLPPVHNHSTIEIELEEGSRQQQDTLFRVIQYLQTPINQGGG